MAQRFADDRVLLSPQEALGLLPEGPSVRVVLGHGICKLVASWDRASVEAVIRESKQCEVGGPRCREAGYGLVVWETEIRPLFCEHRAGVDWEALEAGVAGQEIV